MQQLKKIGTHNGAFHVDEVLACAMLTKHTKEFSQGIITRTRDPKIWAQQDILVDVGGEYNPQAQRYDHHQREFQETFSTDFQTRLSSAGLIYKHFGMEILINVIELIKQSVKVTINIPDLDEKSLMQIYTKLYKNFIQSIDAIDNGVNQYPNQDQCKYQINTHLSAVVNRFNPIWCEENQDENQRFHQALDFVNNELISQIKTIYLSWYPGRKFIERAFDQATTIEESGQIIKLDLALPWKSHLYDIEQERGQTGLVKFVLYPDKNEGWRVQAVSVNSESFENRKSLISCWRGIKDMDQLKKISGIEDIVFVHASGFIGGAKSYDSTLKMAKLSLL